MNQSTLSGLIRKPYRWSPHLPQIARVLKTTVEYLVGETDDPDSNVPPSPPPPPPAMQLVTMTVALPDEEVLTQMFLAMLGSAIDAEKRPLQGVELARDLAMLLPSALGNLRGPLIHLRPADPGTLPAPAEDADAARPSQRRA